jgi:2-(1,2-epoxy-1,2-dihydrophenyl)acetyl-CoA isomerase
MIAMPDEASPVLTEVRQGLGIVTLNRPERLNALSGPVMDALAQALQRMADDPQVRAVLLAAAGRGFCAGGDVKAGGVSKEEAAQMTLEQRVARLRGQMRSAELMHTMAKPTVSALRGAVMGAGVGLGLSADLRIGSRTLKLETAFRPLAFSGDFGGSYFLTRLAGTSVARDLMLRSRRIDAEEALRHRLLTELVDDEQLDARALEVGLELAAGPPAALGRMKQALNAAADGADVAALLDIEALGMVQSGQTAEHREAVRAFVQKRKPDFGAC